MAGAAASCVDALNAGADPVTSIVRVQAVAGGWRGSSVTDMPGDPTSIGIRPVATDACSQTSMPGISSGTPVIVGFVMSTSPIRNVVCVQLLPCAPTSDGD